MNFINIFKLANNVEGTFVEVGFGKGDTTRKSFEAMNNGTLTKRQTWLIDSFKGTDIPSELDNIYNPEILAGHQPGRLQVAMDMRYDLVDENVYVIKSFVAENFISRYTGGAIGCLHIDLPSYSGVISALEALHPLLNKDAIVYIGGYNYSVGIRTAVNKYIEDNKLKYQLLTLGSSKYLLNKVAPVFYTKPDLSREFDTPEDTIPVDRPTIKPFADRYVKPIIEKFRPKKDILTKVVDKLIDTTIKDTEFQPEDTIPVSRPTVKPFKDRYVKEEPTKFVPKETIKEGLDVIDKKVIK
tara:strand:+ start:7266 stop:8159 length:894 start_codon:yes stop_codon:yes gene_type:complete